MSKIRIINGGEEIAITQDELDAILKARKPQLPDGAERWFEFTEEPSHIYYLKCGHAIRFLLDGGRPFCDENVEVSPNLRLKPDLQATVEREAKSLGYERGFVKAFRKPEAGDTIINRVGLVLCHYLATIETPRPIIGFAGEVWREPDSELYATVYPDIVFGIYREITQQCDLRLTFQPGTEFETIDDGSLQVTVRAGQPIQQRVRKVANDATDD